MGYDRVRLELQTTGVSVTAAIVTIAFVVASVSHASLRFGRTPWYV